MDNLTPVGRIVVWTLLAVGAALLATYLPGAMGLAKDHADGRVIGHAPFPLLFVVSLVSGVLYTRGRRRLAYGVVCMMLASVALLELRVI